MKTKNYYLLLLCSLGLSSMAQTYTGTPWKSGGWNYGTNNDVNFAAENNLTSVNFANDNININLNGVGTSKITIYSITGSLLYHTISNSNVIQIPANAYIKGGYLVKVENNHLTESHKLIVR